MSEPIEEPKAKEVEHDAPRINATAQKFLTDLEAEREALTESFPLCAMLIDEAYERVYSTGRIPGREYYADVFKQKPIKVTQKVFVPVKQYPKFNFTGKILGPKGNSLRRLQEETQCKIVIKGRNSIRDRNKEEEMRISLDPRYAHLNKDLYVEISTVATPAESYARVAYALAEIRKFLVPDKNDEVSNEQLRELMEIDPKTAKQYNKTVFDRKMTAISGATKYLNLVKQSRYHAQEEEEEEVEEPEMETYEYETRVQKRPAPPTYEYVKARAAPPAAPYKRSQAPGYGTEVKRLRETPVKVYKPNSYSVLKKYKA